jgi:hypothetical protein
MPEVNMPDVKLPSMKLPDGLRDMSREDIVNAAKDIRMPKLEMPDIDFSKVELPKQVTDRLPGRKRSNPILPIAGVVALGAMVAAAWYLITSPVTGPRIRSAVNDLKARMNGEPTDLIRYDDEKDLGSLISDSPEMSSSAVADDPSLTSNRYGASSVVSDLDGVPESARSN